MIPPRAPTPLAYLAIFIAGSLNLAASFDVVEVPVKHSDAHVFAAKIRIDAPARVWVLDGHTMLIFPANSNVKPRTIQLPPGASALDIADLDGDGLNEIILVDGNRIKKIPLEGNPQRTGPEILFALETALSSATSGPYLHVLAVTVDGRTLLALPRKDQLELRAADGDLVISYPMEAADASQPGAGAVFATATLNPVQAAPAGAIEFQAVTSVDTKPALPDTFAPLLVPQDFVSHGIAAQLRTSQADEPSTWPRFNLAANGRSETTVHYLFGGPHSEDTLIRMRVPVTTSAQGNQKEFTSQRRYPGNLVFPSAAPPDLNRDGYADLVLWKSPLGASIDSMIRSAESGTWPIRLGIHLYSVQNRAYEGRPRQTIESRVPIGWFYNPEKGAPLRNLLFRDFNRDRKKDIAFSSGPRTFEVWLYQEGINTKPDYQAELDQPIAGIALSEDTDRPGSPTIVLRGETSLYILRIPDTKN